MWIVAVTALNQSDIHPMPERAGEFGALRRVAAVAKLCLRLHQHKIHVIGFVRTMATGATDAAGQVLRLGKILGFQAGLVTLGADRRRFGRT
jgi:hypothetical protein